MKRALDLSLSSLALFFLSPLMLVIGFILYVSGSTPVIFCQPRVGKNGKIFHLYKFRTMRPPLAGEDPHSLKRLTSVGKILRSLSLDELPGLFNVIKGDMSLVGPRPLLVHYLERYNSRQNRRHEVLPGITGWAQVNGRNNLSWEEKFELDLYYVENHHVLFDISIMLKTVLVLFQQKSINSSYQETMNEFNPGLYLFGGGGHAKVVISALEALDQKIMGIFDDDLAKKGTNILGIPILGSFEEARKYDIKKAVIAIGNNKVREDIKNKFNLNWINVIHPKAVVHPSAKIGAGTVVFAQAVIQPDAIVGEHVIINSGAIVEHDCRVEDFSHLCPGSKLAGNVTVKKGALLGTGACVIPSKEIGSFAIVGAGSTVITDIAPSSVVAGSPARALDNKTNSFQRKHA